MTTEYRDFVMDLLGPLGPVSARSMFGGTGIWYETVMFALIADDRLYFKATEHNKADFDDEGMDPFTYESSNGRRAVMSYCEVPERLFDEPEELRAWAEKAVTAAVRARKTPAAKPRKSAKAAGARSKPRKATSASKPKPAATRRKTPRPRGI